MSTEEEAIAKVRARVVAWNEHETKRAAWIAAEPNPRMVECVAMTDARRAALDLGPLPTAGELALLARSDRLEALEKAILSSAGDEVQRECARMAMEGIAYCAKTGRLQGVATFGGAHLAQSKALADLRFVALRLADVGWDHGDDCEHRNCPDAESCADGSDDEDCEAPGVKCACYVADIENLIKLARGEAGEKEGG